MDDDRREQHVSAGAVARATHDQAHAHTLAMLRRHRGTFVVLLCQPNGHLHLLASTLVVTDDDEVTDHGREQAFEGAARMFDLCAARLEAEADRLRGEAA